MLRFIRRQEIVDLSHLAGPPPPSRGILASRIQGVGPADLTDDVSRTIHHRTAAGSLSKVCRDIQPESPFVIPFIIGDMPGGKEKQAVTRMSDHANRRPWIGIPPQGERFQSFGPDSEQAGVRQSVGGEDLDDGENLAAKIHHHHGIILVVMIKHMRTGREDAIGVDHKCGGKSGFPFGFLGGRPG